MEVRPRYEKAPHHGADKVKNDGPLIQFRHPAYPGTENLLLALRAYDLSPDGKPGIHHETARIACAIIANCRWDGYFSESAEGTKIELSEDGILTKLEYYFHIDNDKDYAVVPSFSHFRFPHSNLPKSWITPSLTIPSRFDLPGNNNLHDAVLQRDTSCRVTNYTQGTDVAHFVPAAEEAWFNANAMVAYTLWGQPTTCDPHNTMRLRKDTHFIYDGEQMAVVPKAGKWVLHVVRPNSELVDDYHNVELQPLSGIKVEFILARFAATVLSLGVFPMLGKRRRFWLVSGTEAKEKEVAGAELKKMFPPYGRATSRPGSKRQRSAKGDEDEEYWPHDVLSDGEKEYCLCNTSYDYESPRGRSWKRSFDRFFSNLESDETGFIRDETEDRESQSSGSPVPKRACLEIRAKDTLEAQAVQGGAE